MAEDGVSLSSSAQTALSLSLSLSLSRENGPALAQPSLRPDGLRANARDSGGSEPCEGDAWHGPAEPVLRPGPLMWPGTTRLPSGRVMRHFQQDL